MSAPPPPCSPSGGSGQRGTSAWLASPSRLARRRPGCPGGRQTIRGRVGPGGRGPLVGGGSTAEKSRRGTDLKGQEQNILQHPSSRADFLSGVDPTMAAKPAACQHFLIHCPRVNDMLTLSLYMCGEMRSMRPWEMENFSNYWLECLSVCWERT